jgi:hypothetical protein
VSGPSPHEASGSNAHDDEDDDPEMGGMGSDGYRPLHIDEV